MKDFTQQFIQFAIAKEVLRFGEFMTKAGRLSPYFFNSGLFNDGDSLMKLGEFYAAAIIHSGVSFDMLFGPAYKGIPLVSSVSIALARQGVNVPYAFNRKEAKNHGEGGTIVGAALKNKILIVDDVISAGVSVGESVEIIRSHGASPTGVVIAIDRQERGQGVLSAAQEVHQNYKIPVISIANLAELIQFLNNTPELITHQRAVQNYQASYGIQSSS